MSSKPSGGIPWEGDVLVKIVGCFTLILNDFEYFIIFLRFTSHLATMAVFPRSLRTLSLLTRRHSKIIQDIWDAQRVTQVKR